MCSCRALPLRREIHEPNSKTGVDLITPHEGNAYSLHLHRRLMQGMLLQLELPAEVKPSQATAQRSNATGNLLLTMPKERPDATCRNIACSR